jgi:hypothetical protein
MESAASPSWPKPARSDARAMCPAGATPARGGATTPVPLDEVMLAMDVVDTLRHRQQLVEQELAGGDRDAEMLERLRRIYAAQGIAVPDHVLADGVAALREDRFAYHPPRGGAAVAWARVYVSRDRWGKALLAVAAVLVLVWFGYQQTVVAPRQAWAAGLTEGHAAVTALARDPAVVQRAADLLATGRTSLAAGDDAAARRALVALGDLRTDLERSYELRIVVGDGVSSGVWRVPDDNPRARNYYLIVEAVDAAGQRLALPILNEETGRVERVSTWGQRVDEATWQSVAADYEADGIIQQRLVGRKAIGDLEPTYLVPATGGAITRW